MQYKQEIAEKMLADPRWEGAIQAKMLRVWKTRGVIPNQYFNPKYIKFIKEGREDLANQVKDPYFNHGFILRTEYTEAELLAHNRLTKILSSEKIYAKRICEQVGINDQLLFDALRNDKKRVLLRSEHILALKKNLQELRIKIKNVVEKLQDKRVFWDRDKAEIDAILKDNRIVLATFVDNKFYASRAGSRHLGKTNVFEDEEAKYYIERFAIFLLETAL